MSYLIFNSGEVLDHNFHVFLDDIFSIIHLLTVLLLSHFLLIHILVGCCGPASFLSFTTERR